jgi:hypothetical protein
MAQQIHSPVDYGFKWTADWYDWDAAHGHREAKRYQDAHATILRRAGNQVRKFTLRNQVVSRGGVGSNHPHVTFTVTAYGINRV